MVENSTKTYGELILEAKQKTDKQEIGETTNAVMKDLEKLVNKIVKDQAEKCFENGFHINKYYIHLSIIKDPWAPNVLKVHPHPIRITRPSPYQAEDHYLWSVTNMNQIKFEWCIPSKEVLGYILKHTNEFDPSYVNMLHKFTKDKIDNIADYMIKGKIA